MTERRGAERRLDAAKCEDGRRAKRPVNREQVFFARLAGQSLAHLCAGEDIRAMPETEIPPAMRGDLFCVDSYDRVTPLWQKNTECFEKATFLQDFMRILSIRA